MTQSKFPGCIGRFRAVPLWGGEGGTVKYAQIKGGNRLHIVFEAENRYSLPICGTPAPDGYRMTINVPLANACRRCCEIYDRNGGAVVKRRFYEAMAKGGEHEND